MVYNLIFHFTIVLQNLMCIPYFIFTLQNRKQRTFINHTIANYKVGRIGLIRLSNPLINALCNKFRHCNKIIFVLYILCQMIFKTAVFRKFGISHTCVLKNFFYMLCNKTIYTCVCNIKFFFRVHTHTRICVKYMYNRSF